jgi:Nucleotidyl transferase AbiEii toxin, Type IV TA system
MKITLQERIARYRGRDFAEDQAHILILMEEAAIAVFSALPEHFVLIGGATLVLFHNSSRLSKDLDLLVRVETLPTAEELEEALRTRLDEVAGVLALGPVTFERERAGENFLRLWIVGSGERRLFTVDLTKMGGPVLARQIVEEGISDEKGTALIPTASRDYLLLQKAESFVSRSIMKARDAFDIRPLLSQGATLDMTLKSHLHDAMMWREMDEEQIKERIAKIDARLCRAELKPVLADDVYIELEDEGFESLRAAVKSVFEEWL